MEVLHEGRLDSHKIRKLIKWRNDEKELFNWIEFLINYNNQINYIGDTGIYYLPYIKLIIEKLIQCDINISEYIEYNHVTFIEYSLCLQISLK